MSDSFLFLSRVLVSSFGKITLHAAFLTSFLSFSAWSMLLFYYLYRKH